MKKLVEGKAVTISLAIFLCVIITPLLLGNTEYPTITGDFQYHLGIINEGINGESLSPVIYPGEIIFGLPIGMLSKAIGVGTETVFLWFNYLALMGICIALTFVATRIFNKEAGLLMVPLAIFCTQSVLKLFAWGTIYSLINMFLVLPLGLFFLAKWLATYNKYYGVSSVMLIAIFSILHRSAIYLPYTLGIFFAGYIFYSLLRHNRRVAITRILPTGIVIVGINILITKLTMPVLTTYTGSIMSLIKEWIAAPGPPWTTPINLGVLIYSFVSPVTFCILLVSMLGLFSFRKLVNLKKEQKLFLAMLASFLPCMTIGFLTPFGIVVERHAVDFSVITAIIAACLAGLLLAHYKSKVLNLVTAGVVVVGIVPTLLTWFGV